MSSRSGGSIKGGIHTRTPNECRTPGQCRGDAASRGMKSNKKRRKRKRGGDDDLKVGAPTPPPKEKERLGEYNVVFGKVESGEAPQELARGRLSELESGDVKAGGQQTASSLKKRGGTTYAREVKQSGATEKVVDPEYSTKKKKVKLQKRWSP